MKSYNTTPFDWFNYIAQNHNSNALIQFVLKFDTPLDFELLKRALQACMIADPVLNCTFSLSDNKPQFVENEFNISDLCRMVFAENLEQTINCCLSEKIDAATQCSIKLYLIKKNEETVLVIKAHHVLCDAAGALDFVRLLGKMYSMVENDPNFHPAAGTPRRGTESLYRYFSVEDKAAAFNPSLLTEMRSTWGAPCGDLSTLQTIDFQIERFSALDLSRMMTFAKANNSTLNALITSAYHRAFTLLLKPTEPGKEVQFSVNLRHYTEKENPNTICNLSNLFNVQLPVQVSFSELVKQAKSAIDKIIAPEIILQSVLACELLSPNFNALNSFYAADWEQVKQTGLCTPMISNIGRLDEVPINFGKCDLVDMFLVSPAFVAPSLMLSAGTYRKVMTLCIAYQKPSIDEDFVASLLKKTKDILLNLSIR